MTIAGLDFAKADSNFTEALISEIKQTFLAKLTGYTADDISVVLSSGSVKAKVAITPLPGSSSDLLNTALKTAKTTIANDILAEVKAMPTISSVLKDGSTEDQLTITATDPLVAGAHVAALSGADGSRGVAAIGIMAALLRQLLV